MEFLAWIENLSFCIWVRESSSLWAYPGILFMHTVGLGLVAGISAAVALRVLGVARDIPLVPLLAFYRVLWLGFWVNAVSGVVLLMADATTKLVNPVFYIKMAFVALAMIVTLRLRRTVRALPLNAALPFAARVLAIASLVCWTGAITAGRFMAYLGPVSGAPGLNNSLGR